MPVVTKVTPAEQTIYWDRTGNVPQIQSLDLIIQEPPETNVEFVQFYIERVSGTTDWLWSDQVGEYLPTTGGTIGLYFIDLNYLYPGNYQSKVDIFISNSSGFQKHLTALVNLNITGQPPVIISTDKNIYNLAFNRETNQLTGDTDVLILNNTDNVALKFWQNGNIFAAAENFTSAFTLAENSALPMATNPALPETGNVNVPAKILKQTGEFVSGFSINLLVMNGGISVLPQSLAFEIFKNSPEKTQTLSVTNPLGVQFDVTDVPAWLQLDVLTGNTSKTINVSTQTSGLVTGEYSGIIKFQYNSKSLEIPVTLSLKNFIQIDESVDFCLDLPEVVITRKTDGATWVRLTVTAVYTVMGVETNFEKGYEVPYFQNVGRFDLGDKLHQHFPRVKRHFFNEDEFAFLKMIRASLKAEELNSNYEPLFSETVVDIKLFPGNKPEAFPLLSNGLWRKTNKESVVFTSEVQGETVVVKRRNPEVLPNPFDFGNVSVGLYPLPSSFQPVHLQWENQNLCPEWFTFTGEYMISPDFNHIYARNIFNAQNEKYSTSKIKTLTLSTGFFLAKERLLMTEIIESLISFVKIEGKVYRCFNITKKNPEIDSTEQLVSRDLEYLIVEQ